MIPHATSNTLFPTPVAALRTATLSQQHRKVKYNHNSLYFLRLKQSGTGHIGYLSRKVHLTNYRPTRRIAYWVLSTDAQLWTLRSFGENVALITSLYDSEQPKSKWRRNSQWLDTTQTESHVTSDLAPARFNPKERGVNRSEWSDQILGRPQCCSQYSPLTTANELALNSSLN